LPIRLLKAGLELNSAERAGFAPADAADAGAALFRACPIALAPPWLTLTRGQQDHLSCRLPPWGPLDETITIADLTPPEASCACD